MNKCILVIDTDPSCRRLISTALSSNGYEVLCAADYTSGYAQLSSLSPDLVIINIPSTKGEAIKTLRLIREWSNLPVIALCAYDTERITLEILDAGADVFLPKPVSTARLMAYIRVCLRRADEFIALSGSKTQDVFTFGELSVNLDSCEVVSHGKTVHLTKNEFKILSLLCRYSGRVLDYEFIMKQVWGPQISGSNGILRVNITNIRRKIEPDAKNPIYVLTENGVGYRMCEAEN